MNRMKNWICFLLGTLFMFLQTGLIAQDTTAVFNWAITSKKISNQQYQIRFSTQGVAGWHVYAPNQTFSDVPAVTISFLDSAIAPIGSFKDSGATKEVKSTIFENTTVRL